MQIKLTTGQRDAMMAPDRMPTTICVSSRKYTMVEPIASGFKGVVWKVRDEFTRLRALKICTHADYADRSYLEEVELAAALEPYPVFARLYDAGIIEIAMKEFGEQTHVAFVEEWVDGVTIEEFCNDNAQAVTSSFLVAYVKGMADGLHALARLGLRHDDLHANNVMLARPGRGDLSNDWKVKIIDTGSLKKRHPPTSKSKDDHRHFVDHLVKIWNTVRTRRVRTIRDRRFLHESERLLQLMLDDDPSTALRDPQQIVDQFSRAYTRAGATQTDRPVRPSSPFEFISAEHIADDSLLVDIFARSCPFLEKVDGPDPCLVTGPRGCGKSTIFRWLSLKTHLHKDEPETDQFRIAGFYLSCSTDLQNKLGWITTDAIARRFRSEIVHYFNLSLAREVLQTLSIISGRRDRETMWGFGPVAETAVADFVLNTIRDSIHVRVQGVSKLDQATELIEKELFWVHSRITRGVDVGSCTGEGFLGELTKLLVTHVEYFQRKRITFLVDDFSSHRIPSAVQVILNRVIWERRATHTFKLSSEKCGYELTDVLQGTVDVSREMIEVDCGREYLALDDSKGIQRARRFAVELLDNRLKAARYEGNSEVLIGKSQWAEGSLARALVDKRQGRTGTQYHGIDCIARICSGDVSTLLLLYRKIFENGNVDRNTTSLIPKRTQHDAIRQVSRELFEAVKHHVPHGLELYSVVAAFGALVRKILEEGNWHKKGTNVVPSQCPRIELDQMRGAAMEKLTEEQGQIATELVRRAIFIEMEPGLSRHHNVTTLRWHIRRIYLPAFGAALAKNDAVKEPIDWFKYFLTNPGAACDMVWRKWPSSRANIIQEQLFGET